MAGVPFPIPAMPQDVNFEYISRTGPSITASSTANRLDLSDIDETIHRIALQVSYLQSGSATLSTATNVNTLVGTIDVNRGGSNVTSIRAKTIYNWNAIRFSRTPFLQLNSTATDGDAAIFTYVLDSSPYSTPNWVDPRFGWRREGKSLALNLETGAATNMKTESYEVLLYTTSLKTTHALNIRQFVNSTLTNGGKTQASLGQGNVGLSEIFLTDTTSYSSAITSQTGQTIDRVEILRSDKEDVLRSAKAHALGGITQGNVGTIDQLTQYFQIAPPLLLNKPTKVEVVGGSSADTGIIEVGLFEPNA